MEIKNKFIYKLTDRLGTIAVIPLGEAGLTMEFERENEEKNSYKKNVSGKMIFTSQKGYERFLEMETSIYRCDEQVLSIYKPCGDQETEIFSGKISLNEADFNLDKCQIALKFLEDEKDSCIENNESEELNIYNLTGQKISVKPNQVGGGEYEYRECVFGGFIMAGQSYGLQAWCSNLPNTSTFDTSEAYANNWLVYSNLVRMNNSISMNPNPNPDPDPLETGGMLSLRTKWVREIVYLDCAEVPPSEFVLIEDQCSTTGKRKYAKKTELFNCKNDYQLYESNWNFSFFFNCKIVGDDEDNQNISLIDNGVLFKDVVKGLIKNACPDLIVKSDFFQINPDNISNVNYVTGKISTVNSIVIFQKSDVKRPNAFNSATRMDMSLEDLFEICRVMFNVQWRIEGNVFRFEHVSYFQKSLGYDITIGALKAFFVGKKAYSYESSKIPQIENFKFKESSGNPDWTVKVEYKGCIGKGKKNIVNNIIDNVMTDVLFAIANPSSDSSIVSDDGMVFVSTRVVDGEYYINSEDSLTGGRRLNNVFAFAQLFRDFHYFERPMKTGYVNEVLTEFLTTIPTKKGERFAIPIDLCVGFNPDSIIKTGLGNGIVSSGKYSFKNNMMELELLYESNQDLRPNKAPVLEGGGNFTTYKNISKHLFVNAYDDDGFINTLEVVHAPLYGSVDVISNSEIVYTPQVDYVGLDFFSIQALDNLSEKSNLANFTVNTKPSNELPVAVDDEFVMVIGTPFNQQISIFENDSDDYGFFIVNPNLTTNQGVDVVISDFGFFTYVPPVGFEGVDFFDYTIEDDSGAQSTARVSIKVIAIDSPIAMKDFYQTNKNEYLNIDGSLGKESLVENDYTPDGNVYTYTVLEELNKNTDQGGIINILSNGLFSYTPPTDFLGIDRFNYTVSNGNGTDVGFAEISVIPVVYTDLVKVNEVTNGLVIECDGQTEVGGQVKRADFILKFYADSAKTIPFDVTGLKMRVKIKEKTVYQFPTSSTSELIYITGFLTGTEHLLLDDFMTFQETRNCMFELTTRVTITNELIL